MLCLDNPSRPHRIFVYSLNSNDNIPHLIESSRSQILLNCFGAQPYLGMVGLTQFIRPYL